MRLLPLLPVPLATLLLAVLRPGLLVGGASSTRGLLVMAGVGLAGLAVLAALWRRSSVLALWTSSAVVLALMAVLLWPAFRERTVVEAFPPVQEAAQTAVTPTPAPTAAPATSAPATTAPATSAPATAVRLQSGRFRGINHSASGGASLYLLAGEHVVRFEKIDFQGTPTPSVHLVKRGSTSPKGGLRLGGLKGEHGSFSYAAPAGFDPAKGWTVLVWCDRYATPIAAADLA